MFTVHYQKNYIQEQYYYYFIPYNDDKRINKLIPISERGRIVCNIFITGDRPTKITGKIGNVKHMANFGKR